MKNYYIGENGLNELKENSVAIKMNWEVSERGMKKNHWLYDLDNLKSLEIEGFSKIEDCYYVRREYDNFTNELKMSYIETIVPVLRIIESGEAYFINATKKKLRLLAIPQKPYLRDRNFKTTATEPNYIGVGSRTKILAWVDYIKQKESERAEYLRAAYEKNTEFAKKFQAKYPDGNFSFDADGWCNRFVFKAGIIEWKYEALESGEFSRSHYIYLADLPTDEDLLK